MKTIILLLAFSVSSYSMANDDHYLAHECTPWFKAGHTLSNGKPILPFKVYTVGYPVKAAFIQFKGGKKILADVSEYGPFMTYDTGSESVSVRRNGNNYVGQIQYFGKDGNYYVDGVETYDVTCSY
jgi:hypothetical protein